MANESELTSRLLSRCREKWPTWEIWKINDRVAKARPDVEIHGAGDHRDAHGDGFLCYTFTAFAEFKKCAEGKDPRKLLTALQRRTLERLDALGHHTVVVGLHGGGMHTVWDLEHTEPLYGPSRDAFLDYLTVDEA